MDEAELKARTKQFAIDIITFARTLPTDAVFTRDCSTAGQERRICRRELPRQLPRAIAGRIRRQAWCRRGGSGRDQLLAGSAGRRGDRGEESGSSVISTEPIKSFASTRLLEAGEPYHVVESVTGLCHGECWSATAYSPGREESGSTDSRLSRTAEDKPARRVRDSGPERRRSR